MLRIQRYQINVLIRQQADWLTTRWEQYEAIQADIFDHILAVAPEFGLSVFQRRTGEDFRWADDARGK